MATPVQTLQEQITVLSPDDVLLQAKHFFARRNGIYSTFLEREGPGFVTFRGQGGEEVVIGTAKHEAGTRVSGSSYLFDMQVARFLSTLPPAPAGPIVPIIDSQTPAPAAGKS